MLMAGRLTRKVPFGYRAGKTILHRMPAGLKLIFVIIISYFAFTSIYGLAVSILLILIASIAACIPPHSLLKGSKPLVFLSLCVILLKTIRLEGEGIATPVLHVPYISKEGFREGLLAAPGLFVPFAAAAMLFNVTTMRELRLSLALVENSLVRFFYQRRKHTPFFSLGISLMLGFIPLFFEMWDDANLACDSRSCKRGLRRLPLLIPLVAERMIEASANKAMALEARAFGCD
jgi:biotin transport system permease protein